MCIWEKVGMEDNRGGFISFRACVAEGWRPMLHYFYLAQPSLTPKAHITNLFIIHWVIEVPLGAALCCRTLLCAAGIIPTHPPAALQSLKTHSEDVQGASFSLSLLWWCTKEPDVMALVPQINNWLPNYDCGPIRKQNVSGLVAKMFGD